MAEMFVAGAGRSTVRPKIMFSKRQKDTRCSVPKSVSPAIVEQTFDETNDVIGVDMWEIP